MVEGCLFCLIVAGEEPAYIVWEAPETLGFLDTRPLFKGHVLLVPRQHVDTMTDLPEELVVPLFGTAKRIAATMPEVLGSQGSFVAVNNVVSQSVPHLHIHVVPRTKGDGLRGFFWPRTRYADPEETAEYAERLRSALAVAGAD
jgi:histidine triad (HIT) family protein